MLKLAEAAAQATLRMAQDAETGSSGGAERGTRTFPGESINLTRELEVNVVWEVDVQQLFRKMTVYLTCLSS